MRARADHSPLIRAALAGLTLASCGSGGPAGPAGNPSLPSPGTSAGSLNMVLLSHLDLTQLSLPASAE